jgi:D-3-phosphoglycerate dehydrogenase
MTPFRVVMVTNDMPPTPDWVARQLQDNGIKFSEALCTRPQQVKEVAGDADVVWLFGGIPGVVTADVLPHLKRCRAILRTGTGTDNVPVHEATRLGILVANTPEATTHAVAEHAIGLLFAVLRQIAVQDRAIRQGVWDRYRAWPSWHLVGQTLGLLGFGRIARLVVKKTQGLELKVIAHDPGVDAAVMRASGVEPVGLEELLRRADFLSIHIPLLETTKHLIGERELRMMKPHAVLINTSRGSVIDEPALIRALSEHWIAAAGLDVLEQEPPAADHPLLRMDNVVLTPHIGAYSDEFLPNFWGHSVRTLIEMSHNRLPLWCVNPSAQPRWQPAPLPEQAQHSEPIPS